MTGRSCEVCQQAAGEHTRECRRNPRNIVKYPPLNPERRRAIMAERMRANPDGLVRWEITRGFVKADALEFWNDLRALGIHTYMGFNARGTKVYAFPGVKS